jgi:7,8-dihydropterin-6-yl-methyl-4-(beta-D-ribofuranosyl)aminobenzene 5'-phosphate synthase
MDYMLDRREFLKAAVAIMVMLFVAGGILDSAFAQSNLRFTEVDKLTITIITDNYFDGVRPEAAIGKRYRPTAEKSIHAEHGLSYFVETVSGGQTSTFMFDYGVDARGVMRNMELLGVNLEKVDGMGLSHGHWDHWGALEGILKANQGKIPRGTPFYVGQEAFYERASVRPGSKDITNLGKLSRETVESLGGLRIVEVKEPTAVMKGGYFTGNIERVTDYEKVPPNLLIKRGDKLEHDQFGGEQALFFIVKGKGLVVLVGCSHPGIVNTVKHVQKITGNQKVHAVMGGFHLVGLKPEIIQKTVLDIKTTAPEYIVPTHCTGYETINLLQKEMPKQLILNTAGAKYVF